MVKEHRLHTTWFVKRLPLEEDRPLYDDINYCENIIADGSLVKAVEEAIGGSIEL